MIQQLARRATHNEDDVAAAAGEITDDFDLFVPQLAPASAAAAPAAPVATEAQCRIGYSTTRHPALSSTSAPAASAVAEPVAPRPAPALVETPGEQPLQLDVAEGAFSPAFATSGQELVFHARRLNAAAC